MSPRTHDPAAPGVRDRFRVASSAPVAWRGGGCVNHARSPVRGKTQGSRAGLTAGCSRAADLEPALDGTGSPPSSFPRPSRLRAGGSGRRR